MFDTTHPRISRFADLHRQRDMSGKRQPQLPRLVGNCEESVARRVVVHFDEIDALPLEISYRLPGLLRIPDTPPERPVRRSVVENRPGGNDVRALQLPAPDTVAQGQN